MKIYKLKKYIEILENDNLILSTDLKDLSLDTEIKNIEDNSKNVDLDTLFICKGLNYKPEYLDSAIKNGAICYIAEKENITNTNFPHIIVKDIRKSLALVSSLYYNFPATKLNMIGITGTKGKSTTAYYIKSILDNYMNEKNLAETAIVSSINTYDGKELKESLITCPESIDLQKHIANAVDSSIKNLVMEVSSQALKLNRVYNILYTVGVFLNISEDHISNIEHPNFDDYFNSKLKIFKQVENACINLDSDFSDKILESAKDSKKILTFSTKNENADIYGYDIKKKDHSTITFKVRTKQFDKEFVLKMPGLFNVENALASIAVCTILDIPYGNIYEGLKVARASGRMESHVSKDGNTIVIVDYAHNKLSFEKLYESTKQEYPNKKIVTVFGCPGGKAQIRRRDLGRLAGIHSQMNYLTAEDPGPEETVNICNEIAKYIKEENGNYTIVEDRGEAIRQAIVENPNSVILITGKGNETRQKYGTKYIPCLTDTDYAKEALELV